MCIRDRAKSDYEYPVSELPCAKVCIAGNINGDDELDWNDGALAFRDIMNYADGSEAVSYTHLDVYKRQDL